MSDYYEKPKRKRGPRNPYMFLGAGILIGILVAAIAAVGFLFIGVSSESSVESVVVQLEPTVIPNDAEAQFSSQQAQATPIANRLQASAISPDGEHLAFVSVESGISNIYMTELVANDALYGESYKLYDAYGYFSDIVFSPDNTKMIATVDSGRSVLFDAQNRTIISEFPNMGGAAFTRDSDRQVLVGRNNGIRILDLTSDEIILVDQLVRNEGFYTVGAVAVSDEYIAVALDTTVELYDLNDLERAPRAINLNLGLVHDLAFTPNGDKLAIAVDGEELSSGNVVIYDIDANSRTFFDFGTRVFAIAFSQDGEWLAVAGGESGYAVSRLIVYRWDTSSNPIPPNPAYYQPIEFEGHEHTIYDVGFTSEGYLLSSSWDGSVRLWDLFSPDNALSVYYP